MSVKTLNGVQSFATPSATSSRDTPARTYSIEPGRASIPAEELYSTQNDLAGFLEGENPIGCVRGVMWVMAFNASVFVLGFAVWEAFKLLR